MSGKELGEIFNIFCALLLTFLAVIGVVATVYAVAEIIHQMMMTL